MSVEPLGCRPAHHDYLIDDRSGFSAFTVGCDCDVSALEPRRYPIPSLTSLDNETRERLLSSAPKMSNPLRTAAGSNVVMQAPLQSQRCFSPSLPRRPLTPYLVGGSRARPRRRLWFLILKLLEANIRFVWPIFKISNRTLDSRRILWHLQTAIGPYMLHNIIIGARYVTYVFPTLWALGCPC